MALPGLVNFFLIFSAHDVFVTIIQHPASAGFFFRRVLKGENIEIQDFTKMKKKKQRGEGASPIFSGKKKQHKKQKKI